MPMELAYYKGNMQPQGRMECQKHKRRVIAFMSRIQEEAMSMRDKTLHILMYPWLAMGHITPFLQLSNKLAERGHKISFLLPPKTKPKIQSLNLYPNLISFIPIDVPHVDGLPPGAETTADVPFTLLPQLMTAMDFTEPAIETHLCNLKPDLVFFDFTHWLPTLCSKLGIRSVFYCTSSAANIAYSLTPERKLLESVPSVQEMMEPPSNFPPSSSIKLFAHEARTYDNKTPFGSNIPMGKRLFISLNESDAIAIKTVKEMEGLFCEYLESQFKKLVILEGLIVTEPPNSILEEKFAKMLGTFKARTLIYCALGSECTLKKDQFQELALGLELTGLPFLAALKPPIGVETVDQALPEGFKQRVKGRGLVYGGWIQQQLILNHPSVGCFVTHCGFGSLSEALTSECQLVFLPIAGDQLINARLLGGDLKLGVEIARDDAGLFTRDGVCKVIKDVMDNDSKVGKDARANHAKLREVLLRKDLQKDYLDGFVQKLYTILE